MEILKIVERNEKIRVIVLGFGNLAANLIEGLLKMPGQVSVVGLMPASNLKRYGFLRQHASEIALLKLADENKLNVLTTASVNSKGFIDVLNELKPHVILIGEWSEIIKPSIIGFGKLQIINCHGSLLPKYRGACPFLATVFNGNKETGFTYHLVDKGIDTGDILYQEQVEVEEGETAWALSRRVAKKYGETVGPFFRDLAIGKIVRRKQLGTSSYVTSLNSEWGWIPWEMPPEIIDQRMRALYEYLPLATSLNGIVLAFKSGRVVENSGFSNESASQFGMHRLRPTWAPGIVMANLKDKIIVSLSDPSFIVELDKPIYVVAELETPDIKPGDQFQSIQGQSILKVA